MNQRTKTEEWDGKTPAPGHHFGRGCLSLSGGELAGLMSYFKSRGAALQPTQHSSMDNMPYNKCRLQIRSLLSVQNCKAESAPTLA